MGYAIVLIYDTVNGYLKIKTAPNVTMPLQVLYDKILQREGPEKWVYHNSGHMLFSGSDKGGLQEKTQLHLADLLKMIESEDRLRWNYGGSREVLFKYANYSKS